LGNYATNLLAIFSGIKSSPTERMELDRYIWSDERGWEVRLKQLWEYLAQYCYLPRLFDHEVLVKAVQDGACRLVDAPFAYATGKNVAGYHTGVVYRSLGNVYFDDHSLLVHPEHIKEQEIVRPPEELCPNCGNLLSECTCEEPPPPPPPTEDQLKRFYGRVQLDPHQ
jgi:hypothetical protein